MPLFTAWQKQISLREPANKDVQKIVSSFFERSKSSEIVGLGMAKQNLYNLHDCSELYNKIFLTIT
jgi:hypothetical protein